MDFIFRVIEQKDNVSIAKVIRFVLEEHGVDKPGTVYTDPTTDTLFELFQMHNSTYFVVEMNGEIVGGCGIFPTKGLPEDCVELVKLYVLPIARGKGIGKQLMQKCSEYAASKGYKSVYLETMPELTKAIHLYEEVGFKLLNHPLGDSGHFACNIWMLKSL